MSAEQQLQNLGITLPPVPSPGGNYVHAVRTGNLLYLSGKGPQNSTGKVDSEVTVDQAQADAREVGLLLLAVMRAELGSLDRVTRVVKLLGMVNADPTFGEPPRVINGCSDLLIEVFGERGRHARSAVGLAALPNNITVEIEAIVEVAE